MPKQANHWRDSADRKAAEEFKRRLIAVGVPLVEMRAFGSRVRGDFDQESDLDLFLILRERTREIEEKIVLAAWDVAYDAGYVLTPLAVTVEELNSLPLRLSPVVAAVNSEGVRV